MWNNSSIEDGWISYRNAGVVDRKLSDNKDRDNIENGKNNTS